MNQERIVELARISGFVVEERILYDYIDKSGNVLNSVFRVCADRRYFLSELARFADLVAADEREECAMVAQSFNYAACSDDIADAIRARGKA
jgi:hypothetical protein